MKVYTLEIIDEDMVIFSNPEAAYETFINYFNLEEDKPLREEITKSYNDFQDGLQDYFGFEDCGWVTEVEAYSEPQ